MTLILFNSQQNQTFMPRIILPNGSFVFEGLESQPDIMCTSETAAYAFVGVPIAMNTFEIVTIRRDNQSHCVPESKSKTTIDMTHISLTYTGEGFWDKKSHFTLVNKKSNIKDKFTLDYSYYDSYQADKGNPSGAYIFRPATPDAKPKLYNKVQSSKLLLGKHYALLMLTGDQIFTAIIVNDYNDFIRLETTLYGIPYTKQGMEVVMRIASKKINNENTFYTDSMGLEMQKRVLNYRPSWNLTLEEPVAGNYYPVNSMIEIHDSKRALEVIVDRAQGGTSLNSGEIELMLQRRCYRDDYKGLEQGLNETDPNSPDGKGVTVKSYTHFRIRGTKQEQTVADTMQYMKMSLESPPLQLWSASRSSLTKSSLLNLNQQLPSNVKVQVYPEGDRKIFLRVENFMEKFTLDVDAVVNVTDIAVSIAQLTNPMLLSIEEVSNTGLYNMEEMSKKYRWKGEDFTSPVPDYTTDLERIYLEPQRIRSFRLTFGIQSKDSLVSTIK